MRVSLPVLILKTKRQVFLQAIKKCKKKLIEKKNELFLLDEYHDKQQNRNKYSVKSFT